MTAEPAEKAQASDADLEPAANLGAQIAEAIASAEPAPVPAPEPASEVAPSPGASSTPSHDNVTAFIPFAPSSSAAPVAAAKPNPRPRTVRPRIDEIEPCESPKLVERPGQGWDCPACGRG